MSTSSVKRRTTSCALCRKRKVKCDAKSWPCGPCKKAGASCVGGDIDDGRNEKTVPRSLVNWLQDKIIQLEGERETSGGAGGSPATRTRPSFGSVGTASGGPKRRCNNGGQARTRLRDIVSQDMLSPWLGFSKDLPLARFVLSNARLPSTEDRPSPSYTRHGPPLSSIGPANSMNLLQSIPKQVADFLLEVYISRSMASYPIFHEQWLRSCCEVVIHGKHPHQADSPKPYEIFTVSLVMALALSTAARSKQAKASDMAFKLFQHALPHIPDVLTNDFAGLQSLVLLHSYGVMNPAAINVYFLASYMMQACIDQGLHQEESQEHPGDGDLLAGDLKRRVFWTAWELDVSCSAGFGRPITLLPENITTGFHSDLEDSAIHPGHIDSRGRVTKFIAGRVRIFRLIEVEVISVLLHGHRNPMADQSLETWMEGAERRIHAWHKEVHQSAHENRDRDPTLQELWEEMALFADIATPQVIVALFRPCPRIKNPTTVNLLKAFKASVEVAKGYVRQANVGFGSQKYTFQPVHHVFSAAMVFLHTIRECLSDLVSLHSLEDMEDFMSSFTTFFSLTAERWPASSTCMEEYHRLLEPLKQRYIQASQPTTSIVDLDMDGTGEYLLQYHRWISSVDSIGLGNSWFEPRSDVANTESWMDMDSTSVDWGEYFNLGPL